MVRQTAEPVDSHVSVGGRCFHDQVQTHYRSLLQRLGWPNRESSRGLLSLGVTSCTSGQGVSTVAMQLAAAAASYDTQQDRRVLLVDANLARPTLQRTFQTEPGPGLAESLFDDSPLAEAVRPTPVANLSIIPAGEVSDNPTTSLHLARAAELVTRLPESFDLTVYDLPPGRCSAAIRTAAELDGVLLVLEAGRVDWKFVRRTIELLCRAGAHLLGVVLNKCPRHVVDWQ